MKRTNFTAYDTENLRRKDRDHFIHPWTDYATFEKDGSDVMAEAEGVYVYNSDGDRFIDAIGQRISRHAQTRGLIVRPLAHRNVLSPPLILNHGQIDSLVGILRESIEATQDDLVREGLWKG